MEIVIFILIVLFAILLTFVRQNTNHFNELERRVDDLHNKLFVKNHFYGDLSDYPEYIKIEDAKEIKLNNREPAYTGDIGWFMYVDSFSTSLTKTVYCHKAEYKKFKQFEKK